MPRPGEQVGPYPFIRKLGSGQFGEVWLAERRSAITSVKVALKFILDEKPDMKAIIQEAQLWSEVSEHINVLPIIQRRLSIEI